MREQIEQLLDEGDRLYAEEKAKGHIFFRGLRLDAWPALSSALRDATVPADDGGDTETLDCGCVITRGWRCPVHNAP